jgi:FAD/FMN-containing dehydrogenase
MPTWSNWSGSLRFAPGEIRSPANEDELAEIVRGAAQSGRCVRVVGSGHSSTPLVETSDTLVSLEHFRGLESFEASGREATIRAGTTLKEANSALLEVGLAVHNLGDVDFQTVAGVVGTGTHGTGRTLPIIPDALTGVRLVDGSGEIREFRAEDDPDFFRAARVSLGALGIFTSLRMRMLPAYQLHRQEWCTHIEECLKHLDRIMDENRNCDFYWYPRSDLVKIRTLNIPGQGSADLPFARCVQDVTGWMGDVLPKQRDLRFDEMEYWLPAKAGPECFRQVRRRIKETHRRSVGWRLLYRSIPADDAYLSGAHDRDTVTISLHQNAGLPLDDYFNDIEPLFRQYDGRPHWGKKHNLEAKELRPLYPKWENFQAVRRRLDPHGTFLNPYLRRILGER